MLGVVVTVDEGRNAQEGLGPHGAPHASRVPLFLCSLEHNRRNEIMKMWKYAFAWGRNGHIYRDIANHNVTTPVREYISSLGRDGWELCGHLDEGDGYMLKQPAFE